MSTGYRKYLASLDATDILSDKHMSVLKEPVDRWEELSKARSLLVGAKIHVEEVRRDILFGAKDRTSSEEFEIWRAGSV